MARKNTTSEEKKTVLLIPLTEARSRISEQIEKGRELFAIRIMTERQLREAQTKYKIWSDVTRDLLKRKIFNTD
ncbi:MAG: hypothetical protein KJZ60_12445, partial [Ignavibacteriaceae bacterium]|nr:hypothetical protein [Ignavibacteriaceae bacterium]